MTDKPTKNGQEKYAEVVQVFSDVLMERGVTVVDMMDILKNPSRCDLLAKMMRGDASVTQIGKERFRVAVDYSQQRVVSLQGHYRVTWGNTGSDSRHQPRTDVWLTSDACKDVRCKAGKIDFTCLNLGQKVTHAEVLAIMESRGLRPALCEELLALGVQYPDALNRKQIVALGSLITSNRSVFCPCICRNWRNETPSLHWRNIKPLWHTSTRFLATQKS